jgi:hypothetical protein
MAAELALKMDVARLDPNREHFSLADFSIRCGACAIIGKIRLIHSLASRATVASAKALPRVIAVTKKSTWFSIQSSTSEARQS